MVAATVRRTVFDFDKDCQVECYEEWPFYQKRLLASAGLKQVSGCDLVVIQGTTLFLIEVKDYTYPPGTTPPKVRDFATAVSAKGLRTLAGLFAAARSTRGPRTRRSAGKL